MPCPFFMPTQRAQDIAWPHPARLPLGAGWEGLCTVGHDATIQPTSDELREFCNLGYAAGCSRLPEQRACDAVRFRVARERESRTMVQYVCETGHRPAAHGILEYDRQSQAWSVSHPDPRIQRMADCYLQSYFVRKITPAGENIELNFQCTTPINC